MTFIATFFTHFGAIKFKKRCDKEGVSAGTSPVPRALSSSCGTCVRFEAPEGLPFTDFSEEVDTVVRVCDDGSYKELYRSED